MQEFYVQRTLCDRGHYPQCRNTRYPSYYIMDDIGMQVGRDKLVVSRWLLVYNFHYEKISALFVWPFDVRLRGVDAVAAGRRARRFRDG